MKIIFFLVCFLNVENALDTGVQWVIRPPRKSLDYNCPGRFPGLLLGYSGEMSYKLIKENALSCP